MRRHQLYAALAIAPLLALSLAACGGKANASTPTTQDRQAQALQFARCMRDHGVDMPDPSTDGGGVRMQINGHIDKSKVDAAMKACQQYLPRAADGRNLENLKNDPAFQQAQLSFARCMRDHGIDMPDPGTNDNGPGIVIKKDQDSAKMQAAMTACEPLIRNFLGGKGLVTSGVGGGK